VRTSSTRGNERSDLNPKTNTHGGATGRHRNAPPIHINKTPPDYDIRRLPGHKSIMQKIIETIVSIPVIYRTIFLLVCANCFMTYAWYGHLKNMASKPWWMAAIVSWSIALLEYLLQVPANRIGYGTLTLAQLKIIQEVITLSVFVPFSMLYMKEGFRLDFIWAGLCLCGAVFFIFRK